MHQQDDTMFKRSITCLSQLLCPSLSRRGNRPSDLDLMNCFHFHTYFSIRYCLLISALFKGLEGVSWPEKNKSTRSNIMLYLFFHTSYKTTLTSSRKALFPGIICCFGILLEPELGLGMYLIAIGFDCSQRFDSSILTQKQHYINKNE